MENQVTILFTEQWRVGIENLHEIKTLWREVLSPNMIQEKSQTTVTGHMRVIYSSWVLFFDGGCRSKKMRLEMAEIFRLRNSLACYQYIMSSIFAVVWCCFDYYSTLSLSLCLDIIQEGKAFLPSLFQVFSPFMFDGRTSFIDCTSNLLANSVFRDISSVKSHKDTPKPLLVLV